MQQVRKEKMRIIKPKPRYKINYNAVANHLGVKLRGNETFTELLEIEKQVKEYKERKQRIAEENANIQRVDAQTKKYWGK
mgnify:CR=1 FL=1